MPKVTIKWDAENRKPFADPDTVVLTRDDQTIMWELDEGLSWGSLNPITYLPGGNGPSACGNGYVDWPSTASQPEMLITNLSKPVDKQPFWASANKPMQLEDQECYRYLMDVFHESLPGVLLRVKKLGKEYDPDVENDPHP